MPFDELRVHGVSGTPPRSMLYTDPITDSAADDYTKVYQVRVLDQGHDPAARAFHWGGLTAGNRWTALWIFLSPFALANLAGWLVKGRSRWTVTMVRLAGLALTALFAAQLVNVVALLEQWMQDREPGAPSQVLVVAAGLAALAVTFVITGWLSTQSHFAPLTRSCRLRILLDPRPAWLLPREAGGCDPVQTEDWSDPSDRRIAIWAADSRLWLPASILSRLRRLHLAVGFGIVAWVMARGLPYPSWWSWTAGAVVVAAGVLVVLTTVQPESIRVLWGTALLAPVALLLTLATVVGALWVERPSSGLWPGIDQTVFVAGVAFGAAALLVVPHLKSVGALTLAVFLGASLGLAAVTVASRALFDADHANVSDAATWIAVWMLRVVLVVLGVSALLTFRRLEHEDGPFDACEGLTAGARRRRELVWTAVVRVRRVSHHVQWVLSAVALAGVVGLADLAIAIARTGSFGVSSVPRPGWSGVVWWAVVSGALLVAAILPLVGVLVRGRLGPVALGGLVVVWLWTVPEFRGLVVDKVLRPSPLGIDVDLTELVDLALAVAVLLPASFFLRSITSGLGSGESRRKTGVMWDVVSFWPRFFHPLAPPAYGPNAVNELHLEIAGAVGETDPPEAPFAVGAHSQGSMVTAIALTQMPVILVADITRIVTYGSPLGLIYGHLFGATGLDEIVATKSGHPGLEWHNLWRRSDYLGGHPIGDGAIQNHEADFISHSGYECTRQFRAVKTGEIPPSPDLIRPCGGCPQVPSQ